MLVVVCFNYKEYRFREENEEFVLIYNVRKGTILFLTGWVKERIKEFIYKKSIDVDLKDGRINYLVENNILLVEGKKNG